jgi:hypothetical protein
MPLKFHCVCGQALIVSRRLIGKGVRCPGCDTKVKVPAPRGHSDAAALDEKHPRPPTATSPPRSSTSPPAISPDTVAEEVAESVVHNSLVRGCEPHPRDVSATHWLAVSLAGIALCGVIPAALDIFDHLRTEGSPGVAVWAYLSLWIALLQISYAIYLAQLPDWSSVWVGTLVTLAISVLYAMLLGLTYLSRHDSWLVEKLELSDQLSGGRAAGWCFIMLCLTSLVSYLSGRMSMRWYQLG